MILHLPVCIAVGLKRRSAQILLVVTAVFGQAVMLLRPKKEVAVLTDFVAEALPVVGCLVETLVRLFQVCLQLVEVQCLSFQFSVFLCCLVLG